MFDYSTSVRSQRTVACTPDLFDIVVGSEKVRQICEKIASLHERHMLGKIDDKAFAKQKNALKQQLPVFMFHAHFSDHRRSNVSAEPSGLSILDIDHLHKGGTPKELWERIEPRAKEMGIVLAHVTPSCEGLRLVFIVPDGLDLPSAQKWMFDEISSIKSNSTLPRTGETEGVFDGACKDYARCSFAVPKTYILYIDRDGLFTEQQKSIPHQASPKGRMSEHLKDRVSDTPALGNQKPPLGGFCPPITGEPKGVERRLSLVGNSDLTIFDNTVKSCHLTIQDLNTEGRRHTSLVVVLGSGITRIIPKERLWAVVRERMPEYSQEDDCRKLVDDWYAKYNDDNRPLPYRMQKIFTESIHPTSTNTTSTSPSKGGEQYQGGEDDEDSSEEESTIEKQLSNFLSHSKLPPPFGLVSPPLEGSGEVVGEVSIPVLCSVLPLLGAYADGVQVRYIDNQLQKLALMSVIIGPQASGKSACTRMVNYWLEPMLTDDHNARDLEAQWRKKVREALAKKQDTPDPPDVPVRYVPITISCSALLRRLKLSHGHTLYSLCEELDTMVKTNGAGSWSEKYDIYRLAFDNGLWGQDYNSDVAESGMARVNYNLTLMGTYGAFRRCFSDANVENGLSSRFLVAEMPDYSFAPLQKVPEISGAALKAIKEGVQTLASANGFYDTPLIRAAIEEWVEQKRLEALASADIVKDTYRKRAAVIGFRCGCIYMLLDGHESHNAAKFATLMAEYTLAMQCKFFGETLAKIESGTAISLRRGRNVKLLDKLPSVFNMSTLKKASVNPSGNLKMIIHRWVKAGWVKKTAPHEWTKTTFRTT